MLRSNDNRDKAEIDVQKSILGDMDNNQRNKEFRNGSEKFEEVRGSSESSQLELSTEKTDDWDVEERCRRVLIDSRGGNGVKLGGIPAKTRKIGFVC